MISINQINSVFLNNNQQTLQITQLNKTYPSQKLKITFRVMKYFKTR